MNIEKETLKALAAEPNATAETIGKGLGISASQLYYEFKKDPSLKEAYEEGRRLGREAGGGQPRTRAVKEKGLASTPPRNGNAKSGPTKVPTERFADLLLKAWLEFEHIHIYGEGSEHFQELREQIAGLR